MPEAGVRACVQPGQLRRQVGGSSHCRAQAAGCQNLRFGLLLPQDTGALSSAAWTAGLREACLMPWSAASFGDIACRASWQAFPCCWHHVRMCTVQRRPGSKCGESESGWFSNMLCKAESSSECVLLHLQFLAMCEMQEVCRGSGKSGRLTGGYCDSREAAGCSQPSSHNTPARIPRKLIGQGCSRYHGQQLPHQSTTQTRCLLTARTWLLGFQPVQVASARVDAN